MLCRLPHLPTRGLSYRILVGDPGRYGRSNGRGDSVGARVVRREETDNPPPRLQPRPSERITIRARSSKPDQDVTAANFVCFVPIPLIKSERLSVTQQSNPRWLQPESFVLGEPT